MGGHGGLNILPQKKWNVYNYDNRDIVEKDKKLHAQKMKNKYQNDRKKALSNKFDVLKAESPSNSLNQDQFKNLIHKDSILNNEFKRLAEGNQHVNLFEHEQKILQNREVLEYKKLKEAQFLKGKDLDYSSKFLGTYNEDSKIPWYAKTKSCKQSSSLAKQRYDMEDLIDQIREQKERSKHRQYREWLRKERKLEANEQPNCIIQEGKVVNVKRQELNSDRERSRDRKHEFLRRREEQGKNIKEFSEWNKEFGLIAQKPEEDQTNNSYKQNKEIKDTLEQNHELNQDQKQKKIPMTIQEQEEIERLRQKRLKREEKERKRINQLKRKLLQTSN